MTSPCKDCDRRKVGCHSGCEAYKEYAASREEYRKKRKNYNITDGYIIQKAKQMKKRRKDDG